MKTFYIIGGDSRIQTVKKELKQAGYRVYGDPTEDLDPEGLAKADYILCGVPFTGDGKHLFAPCLKEPILIEKILLQLSKGQVLFGGKIPKPVVRSAEKVGVKAIDYTESESFEIKNAILTAEGAIPIVVNHMKRSVMQAHILVIGYGRIGTFLSERLERLGARVTVATGKKENFAWLSGRNMSGVLYEDLLKVIPTVDCVLNTSPKPVVPREIWEKIDQSIPLIELASLPGAFAGLPNGRVISGAALPGKTSPESAGIIIKDTILDVIKKEG